MTATAKVTEALELAARYRAERIGLPEHQIAAFMQVPDVSHLKTGTPAFVDALTTELRCAEALAVQHWTETGA